MNNSDSNSENNYWGFWATIGFGFLVFIVFSIIQTLFLLGYIFINEGDLVTPILNSDATAGFENLSRDYIYNGDAISVAEIPAALAGTAMVIWFASMRAPITVTNYLELHQPKIKSLLLYLGLIIIVMVVMEGLNYWLDKGTPEFMTLVYTNTKNIALLWIAVTIAAPFFEEFLFRGFLLRGLQHSRLGVTGAVFITSASWAIIHVQYGWFEIISIFFIGILLALAKLKSKSLYVPVAMHMLMNLSASIGMELSK